ncbi:uncharacterized protein LOC111864940 [Cryptotermes secundus]|uniref:uncharacterized protein LOC111864940 n=1 Tax=Cryptotermes secundus TaxID=105785 RepID=UPI000CD7ABBE|nr:uncharacterized protein LOC111864940 [Cryptotermes secundus]
MTTTHYSTAFAHLVSAGASLWAIRASGTQNFPRGSFGTFLINSAIGILTFGNPEFGDKLRAVYRHTLFLSKCFGLPCIATQVCLNSGVQEEVAYLHLGFSALPIIAHFLEDRHEKNLLDTVLLGNLISVVYFSYVSVNYYGFALVVSYMLNHFVIRTDGTAFDTSIPSLDLFMYGLCFFYFFAVKTISD